MSLSRVIYVIEDDNVLASGIVKMLEQEGYLARAFEDAESCIRVVKDSPPGLVISDVHLPGLDGLELMEELSAHSNLPIILITADSSTDLAIEATKAGAYDFLEKPFTPETLLQLVAKAFSSFSLAVSRVDIGESQGGDTRRHTIIGNSPKMREIYKQVGRIAATPISVLINGETGTGKELIAQALFHHGDRSNQPFLAINCMAIPQELIESELFGHEKGSFTGAQSRRIGRFEQAKQGTLFLDEIGDLPIGTQAKLLRVLQEGVIQRVGSNFDIPIQTRVIAATHKNLPHEVQNGNFREDLYYRLSTAEVLLPSLRERREDIPLLITYFLKRYGERLGAASPAIAKSAIKLLESQPWPGNVRELQNVIQKALIESRGLPISKEIVESCLYTTSSPTTQASSNGMHAWIQQLVDQTDLERETDLMSEIELEVERAVLKALGKRTLWNKAQLAKVLGWSRPTVYQKLKKYEVGPTYANGS
ncbi:MAG: sigma-54 dependent transcriptional regulator [Verrucomicrobiota bacterium]